MLRVRTTKDEAGQFAAAARALKLACERNDVAYLAAPSFDDGLTLQKELSAAGLGLGVNAGTLASISGDLWRLWGDGTSCVDPVTRRLLVRRAMRAVPRGLMGDMRDNPGTIDVICKLASRALPWLPLDADGHAQEAVCSAAGLSESEVAAIRVAGAYRGLLHRDGYVEASEVYDRLPGVLPAVQAEKICLVTCGHLSFTRAEREFMVGMAAAGNVEVCLQVADGPAGETTRASLALLRADAERAGVELVMGEGAVGDTPAGDTPAGQAAAPARDPEIDELLAALFNPGKPIASTGAVELLQPAGPVAEMELIATKACDLARVGATSIIVAVRDTDRAWAELAPKLAARGLAVRARVQKSFADIYAGRVFAAYLREVAMLKELAETWPAKVDCEEGKLVALGDMSWWPPQGLIDFLMHNMARLPRGRAWDIDRNWRCNRLLTPAAVLDELMSPKKTSDTVAKATAELALGRVGSCASKLMARYRVKAGQAPTSDAATDEMARQEEMGVLQATMMVAGALAQLGVTAAPLADNAVPLSNLVEQVIDELEHISVVLTPQMDPADRADGEKPAAAQAYGEKPAAAPNAAPCTVTIVSLNDAAKLKAASTDAVIYCAQTATESPVGRTDDVLSRILEVTGVDPAQNQLARQRAGLARAVAAARTNVVFERCLFDADSAPTFPSVMLCEVYAAYGIAASAKPQEIAALPHTERPEALLAQNLLDDGTQAAPALQNDARAAGAIDAKYKPLILVTNGLRELPGGAPMLSASQIESYLECPYKWFSLRRLGLDNVDAGFTGTEMGTFVHRVLELARVRLLNNALEAAREEGRDIDLAAHPEERLAASRVTAQNLEEARQIVAEEFDNHLRHQFLERKRVSKMDQLLVAHATFEEEDVNQAKQDLLSLMDFEANVLVGYEPRWLEWGFGGAHDEPVGYAGVWLNGKIDRMDVDGEGRALIIDYKHKSPVNFNQYDAFRGDFDAGKLPRHVQSLIYAQVVRRARPEIRLEGALFLATKGAHALAGACAESQVDRILGVEDAPRSRRLSMGIEGPSGGTEEFWEYLDDVEAMVAEKIGDLMRGKIDACPVDADACSYCPHLHCEKRMGA